MSTHVASHTRSFPHFHGTKVAPSGLLPSEREIPLGSSRDGIRDAPKALWMISFKEL